jgi:superfamily II DNA/RNA helicase
VELHGDLNQSARARNLAAFHAGRVGTLVATDIAARGIHVDDVALVVHADPPVEQKAYVHRSGRTGRAGKAGTVIILTTSAQLRDVRALTRAAGIRPVTTRVENVADPILRELAPGERVLIAPGSAAIPARPTVGGPRSNRRRPRTEPSFERPKRSPEHRSAPGKPGKPGKQSRTTATRSHSAAQFSGRARTR